MFKPYSTKQIQTILEERLNGLDAFERDAVRLISMKVRWADREEGSHARVGAMQVAAQSGDVRRALQLCRRGVELAVTRGDALVSTAHVRDASEELLGAPLAVAAAGASLWEQCLLLSVAAHLHSAQTDAAPVPAFYSRYRTLVKHVCSDLPTEREVGVGRASARLVRSA